MKLSNNNNFNTKNGDILITLMKKNQFEQIKESLKNTEFKINVDYTNDHVNIEKKHGGFLFVFLIGYSKEVKNYIGSDYLNPEEYTLIFEINEVSELEVYDYKNNIIEVSDDENLELLYIIESKVLGQQIIS